MWIVLSKSIANTSVEKKMFRVKPADLCQTQNDTF